MCRRRRPVSGIFANGIVEQAAVVACTGSSSNLPPDELPLLRLRFVDELIKFCKEHNLDGVDYDWEAPSNQAEAKNYGILLSNTKKLFRAHKLMVTVAIHVWQDLGKVGFNAVDRVHLMAYDAHKQLDATGNSPPPCVG